MDIQKVIDDDNGHYMLQSVGWEGKHWVYGSFVHIDVKPTGRVWLQHDGTDLRIANDLEKRGIPKFDIVVGFQPTYIRPLMDGYALD